MSDSSRISFEQLRSSGKLRKLRLSVAQAVYANPGCTQNEAWEYIRKNIFNALGHSISPRFCSLVRMKVLTKGEKRPCNITGRKVNTYWPTYQMPADLDKRDPGMRTLYNQALKKIEELEEQIQKLTGKKPKGQTALDLDVEQLPSKKEREALCLAYIRSAQTPADWLALRRKVVRNEI